jgi:hypothetical protein
MLSKIKPLHLLIVGIALIVIAFFWLNKSVVQDEIIEIDPEPEDTTIKQPRRRKAPEPEPEPEKKPDENPNQEPIKPENE